MIDATPLANDFFPPFSPAEMRARRARVQAAMPEQGVDALLVWGALAFGTSPGQINLAWLANYASVGQCYLVLAPQGDPSLVLGTVPHVRNARDLTSDVTVRAGVVLIDEVIATLRELSPRRIGLVGPYAGAGFTLPQEHAQALRHALPQAEFTDVTGWYERFQIDKTDEELALLRRAGQLGDAIFRELLGATRPGATDTALRRLVARACIDAGATHPFSHIGSFDTSDPPDHYPDFYPRQNPLRAGSVLQTELCVGFGNYWNKIWGTWFLGQPPDDYLRMHAAAREAHARMIAAIRPGVVCAELDAHAQSLVSQGHDMHIPLLMGWSMMNHGPLAAVPPGTRWSQRAARYRDWVLQPGQSLTVICWISLPGSRRGLWVGTSGAVTAQGFERFNGDIGCDLHVLNP